MTGQDGAISSQQIDAECIFATIREPVLVLDAALRVVSANRSFYKSFQVDKKETENQRIYDLGNGQWDIPSLRQLLENLLPQNTKFDDFELEHEFPYIGQRTMLLNARRIYKEHEKTQFILLAIEDITKRKKLADALRVREEYLGITLQSIGDAVMATDMEGNVSLMNPVAEQLTGWKSSEAVGLPLEHVFRIINEDSRLIVESPVRRVLREGIVVGLANHTLLLSRDGREIPIADSGSPIRDRSGCIYGVVLVFRDQSEERRAQDKLEQARLFVEGIVETIHDPILVLDAALRVVSANRSFYKSFQVDKIETENQRIYDLGNGQWDIPSLRQLLENLLPRNTKFDDFELEHEFPYIGQRTMLLNARRIYKEHEKTQFILLAIRDITERKKREQSLLHLQEDTRSIIDTARDSFIRMNVKGEITDWNGESKNIFGWSRGEALGQRLSRLIIPPEYREAHEKGLQHFLASGEGPILHKHMEINALHRDGHSFPVELSIVAVGSGEDIVFNGFIRDLTTQIKARKSLKDSLVGTIVAVSRAVEARDPYTAGHERRVAELSRCIAQKMGLDPERVDGLRLGATIHDIGKIYLPAEILSKPTKLTDTEFELIKSHCQVGYDILKDIKFPWPVVDIVYQHHERLDGSGYPQGLKGDEICLEARIVAVADVVEAISSHRPYRAALGSAIALEEISKYRGRWFDPDVVDACLELFAEGNFSFDVNM